MARSPTSTTLKRLIRKATVTSAFYPMLCGSAFKNKGVQPLLDAVVDYLPSPADREAFNVIDTKTGQETMRRPLDTEPLSMLAFKIMDDPHVGGITFCRVYSGKVESGMAVTNTTRDKKERVGRMYLMHADDREQISEAFAGDIIALAGLKDTRTGETLSDPLRPVLLEKMEFPNPVIEQAIEPKSKGDQEKMGVALQKLVTEDPSFRVATDPESGQTIIKGMGELHLEIKVDILKRTHKVEVNVGAPQVAYRETLARPPRSTTRTRSRPAAPASSRASSCGWSRTRPARATSSRARSSAAWCRRSTSPASRRASSRCGTPAC